MIIRQNGEGSVANFVAHGALAIYSLTMLRNVIKAFVDHYRKVG